jgi:3-dehydroquinate dehydratase-1
MHEDPDQILQTVDKAVNMGADLLEIRLDALVDPDASMVIELLEKINHPFIATNRMVEEGGFFQGSEKSRIKILYTAVPYAEFIDIELQTSEKFLDKIIEASKSSIVSFHDFDKTPDKDKIIEIVKISKKMGDLAKFAVMPHSMKDTLTVIEVLSEFKDVIGISMGKYGKYTRVVGPLFGSPITYATIENKSAPGQLDLLTTKKIIENLRR